MLGLIKEPVPSQRGIPRPNQLDEVRRDELAAVHTLEERPAPTRADGKYQYAARRCPGCVAAMRLGQQVEPSPQWGFHAPKSEFGPWSARLKAGGVMEVRSIDGHSKTVWPVRHHPLCLTVAWGTRYELDALMHAIAVGAAMIRARQAWKYFTPTRRKFGKNGSGLPYKRDGGK